MCNWELLPLLRVHIHVYLYMYDFHRKMFFLDYTYPFFLLEKVRLTILFTLSSYTDVLFTAVCSYEQILVHWIGSCGVVSHAPSPRGQWAERPAPAAPPCARTHHRTNAKTKLMAAGRAEHDCTRPGSCLYARPDFHGSGISSLQRQRLPPGKIARRRDNRPGSLHGAQSENRKS
jgi:hypothetical protein